VSISTYPATQVAEKVLFVIPSEARDLLFFAKPKKKQIPRANPALRNDSLRVFPQPLQSNSSKSQSTPTFLKQSCIHIRPICIVGGKRYVIQLE
jgi:hypothetical protein